MALAERRRQRRMRTTDCQSSSSESDSSKRTSEQTKEQESRTSARQSGDLHERERERERVTKRASVSEWRRRAFPKRSLFSLERHGKRPKMQRSARDPRRTSRAVASRARATCCSPASSSRLTTTPRASSGEKALAKLPFLFGHTDDKNANAIALARAEISRASLIAFYRSFLARFQPGQVSGGTRANSGERQSADSNKWLFVLAAQQRLANAQQLRAPTWPRLEA